MRVAWFRAGSSTSVDVADATSAVIDVLATTVTINVVTESRAHDFVVEHALRPYDVCVFEVRNEPGSEFIWAYLFQYSGVLVLRDRSLHDSRVRALERHRRSSDYAHEFSFNHGHASRASTGPFARGSWPMLRAPLQASRLVVVDDEQRRIALESAYPGVKVREVPPCAPGPVARPDRMSTHSPDDVLRIATVGTVHRATVERAVQRACDAGARIALISADPSGLIASDAGVLVSFSGTPAVAHSTVKGPGRGMHVMTS